MTCRHCRFDVPLDDVALTLRDGVLCLICFAALAGVPRPSHDRLVRLFGGVPVSAEDLP